MGEVIRKKELNRFNWYSYENACKLSNGRNGIEEYGKDVRTYFILYDTSKEGFLFPLAKVHKFLEYGRQDNLWSFAMVVLDRTI